MYLNLLLIKKCSIIVQYQLLIIILCNFSLFFCIFLYLYSSLNQMNCKIILYSCMICNYSIFIIVLYSYIHICNSFIIIK